MKRFLSIDWDFFIDATADQRALLFPDGGNEDFNTNLRKFIWDSLYRNPELLKIEVIPEYSALLKLCKKFKGDCMIADSHRHAYDFIMDNTYPDEEFEVYNIDFHHDLYNYRTGESRVNCGNWGTVLFEDRPNMKYFWVCQDDSDPMTIGDVEVEVPRLSWSEFITSIRQVASMFDYLYLCRSALWSPPHLDDRFVKVARTLMGKCYTKFEQGIDVPREYEIPEETYQDLLNKFVIENH